MHSNLTRNVSQESFFAGGLAWFSFVAVLPSTQLSWCCSPNRYTIGTSLVASSLSTLYLLMICLADFYFSWEERETIWNLGFKALPPCDCAIMRAQSISHGAVQRIQNTHDRTGDENVKRDGKRKRSCGSTFKGEGLKM